MDLPPEVQMILDAENRRGLPQNLLDQIEVSWDKLIPNPQSNEPSILDHIEFPNASIAGTQAPTGLGLTPNDSVTWSLAFQTAEAKAAYQEKVLDKAIELRAACTVELQKMRANPLLRDAERDLAKFANSKPEEIKQAMFSKIKKFMLENPKYLPELQDHLKEVGIESSVAVKNALEAVDEARQDVNQIAIENDNLRHDIRSLIKKTAESHCLIEVAQNKAKQTDIERLKSQDLSLRIQVLEQNLEDAHAALRNVIDHKDEEIENLNMRNEMAGRKLEDTRASFLNIVADKDNEIGDLNMAKSAAVRKHNQIHQAWQDQKKQIRDLTKFNDDLSESLNTARTNWTTSSDSFEEVQKKLMSIQVRLDETALKLSITPGDNCLEPLLQTASEVPALRRRLYYALDKVDDQVKLKDEALTSANAWQDSHKNRAAELAQSRLEVTRLKDENESLIPQVGQLKIVTEELARHQQETHDLQKACASLQADNVMHQSKIEYLNECLERQNLALKKKTTTLDNSLRSGLDLQRSLYDNKQQIEALQRSHTEACQKLLSSQQSLNEVTAEHHKVVATNQALEIEVEKLKPNVAKVAAHEVEIMELRAGLQELTISNEKNISNLESQNIELQEQVSSIQSQNGNLVREITCREKDNKDLMNEIKVLREEAINDKKQIERLDMQHTSLTKSSTQCKQVSKLMLDNLLPQTSESFSLATSVYGDYADALVDENTDELLTGINNHTRIHGLFELTSCDQNIVHVCMSILHKLQADNPTVSGHEVECLGRILEHCDADTIVFGLSVLGRAIDTAASWSKQNSGEGFPDRAFVMLRCLEILLSHSKSKWVIAMASRALLQLKPLPSTKLVQALSRHVQHKLNNESVSLANIIHEDNGAVHSDIGTMLSDGVNIVVVDPSCIIGYIRSHQFVVEEDQRMAFRIHFHDAPIIGTKTSDIDQESFVEHFPRLLD